MEQHMDGTAFPRQSARCGGLRKGFDGYSNTFWKAPCIRYLMFYKTAGTELGSCWSTRGWAKSIRISEKTSRQQAASRRDCSIQSAFAPRLLPKRVKKGARLQPRAPDLRPPRRSAHHAPCLSSSGAVARRSLLTPASLPAPPACPRAVRTSWSGRPQGR